MTWIDICLKSLLIVLKSCANDQLRALGCMVLTSVPLSRIVDTVHEFKGWGNLGFTLASVPKFFS
jgi:hypothetical protein